MRAYCRRPKNEIKDAASSLRPVDGVLYIQPRYHCHTGNSGSKFKKKSTGHIKTKIVLLGFNFDFFDLLGEQGGDVFF